MMRFIPLLCLSSALMTPMAMAQTTYSSSSSDVVIASADPTGLSLADLTPSEIAADVRTEYNPRTGLPEFIGPTFDPFGQDEHMAAQVNLRSVTEAVDLDGNRLRDGVLLDVSLFYSSDPDSRYGRTRDAVFLNGEPVPVILSDRVELECSSRVTETIYTSDYYYHPGVRNYRGLHRRAPVYLNFGFGYYDPFVGGVGRGFGYGYGPSYRRDRRRWDRRGWDRPRRDRRGWDRPTRPRRDDRPVRDRDGDQEPDRIINEIDDSGRGRPRRQRDYNYGGPDKGDTRRNERRTDRPRRPRSETDRPRRSDQTGRNSRSDRTTRTRRPTPTPRDVTRRPDRRDVTIRPNVSTPRVAPPRTTPPRTPVRPPERPRTADKPRRVSPPVSRPRPAPRPAPKPSPAPKPAPAPKPRRKPVADPSTRIRPGIEFFPRDQYDYSSSVVTTARDCAYEDRLQVFISNERLQAARFDGLTVFVRDISYDSAQQQTTVYGEQAIYVPPNYIEGFRQVAPKGRTQGYP